MISEKDIRMALNTPAIRICEEVTPARRRDTAFACTNRERKYLGLAEDISAIIDEDWLGVSDEERETVLRVKGQLKKLAIMALELGAKEV